MNQPPPSTSAPSAGPTFSCADLARRLGASLLGPADVIISGVNSLADACPSDITFVSDSRHAAQWLASSAGAVITSSSINLPHAPAPARAVLSVPDVGAAVILLLSLFDPPQPPPVPGIHPSACVHPSVEISAASIGPFVWIDQHCRLGRNVVLHPGVRLYHGVSIGDNTILHANTVVRHRCVIGARCLLHQNVSIGADGFGFHPSPDGRSLLKFPHIGNVIIADDVEIGANSCIDRAKFGSTRIGAGTKIDNLCQIGHNVSIGRSCVIAANCGISGSVTIGNAVRIGGGVGVADHLSIGDAAQVGAMSGVMKCIPAGQTWAGFPAQEASRALREVAALRKLAQKPPRSPAAG